MSAWFVVLPDSDTAHPVATVLRSRAVRELSHPSGRPWLLGQWTDESFTVGRTGRNAVALLGQHAVGPDELARAADRVRTPYDLDRFVRSLVGSSHLVASVDGSVRVQGTVTGTRRVFHATVSGV